MDANPKNGSYSADEFRNNYNPGAAGSAGANSFFASYKAMIVQQATIAQAGGAQLLCIGAELDQITGPAYKSYWDDIIAAVRQVFTGKLTYSANWDTNQGYWQYNNGSFAAGNQTGPQYITNDLSTQVSFWSALDYVGIDQYAPLSDAANPTQQDLVNGWTQAPSDPTTSSVTGGQSLIAYYESVAAATGKPILFTELGYANSSDAAANPAVPGDDVNGNPDGAAADPKLQASLYQAFFQAWTQAGNSSLAGTYMWNWEPGGAGVSPFSPQGLPAEAALAAGYAAVCYLQGTRIAAGDGEVAVEDLRPGDRVAGRYGGMRRITWIGRQSYGRRFVRDDREVTPVCIAAGALGMGVPARDLFVSPGHSVLLGDTLVLAKALVNGVTITQSWAPESIHYFNIEVETHDCVRAEGAWAETYADCPGMRARFHNAASFFERYPGHVTPDAPQLCAPRPLDGPELSAALQPVVARAMAGRVHGRVCGYLETVDPAGVIRGWAYDDSHPDMPVLLDIVLDDAVIGRVLACDFRADLRAAGLGRGHCSFAWPSGRALTRQQAALVEIRCAADGRTLPCTEDLQGCRAAA